MKSNLKPNTCAIIALLAVSLFALTSASIANETQPQSTLNSASGPQKSILVNEPQCLLKSASEASLTSQRIVSEYFAKALLIEPPIQSAAEPLFVSQTRSTAKSDRLTMLNIGRKTGNESQPITVAGQSLFPSNSASERKQTFISASGAISAPAFRLPFVGLRDASGILAPRSSAAPSLIYASTSNRFSNPVCLGRTTASGTLTTASHAPLSIFAKNRSNAPVSTS